ncbi:methyl-accepting chemotaxis protein [Patulibacter americanus]|uniref:methyl-accepting chemotaxis protein n=1 Tax=Patulibacter americanus TaxID=588672 RepID=UPI0003B65732|nr:methyl-accepting chemotaxis protein [Patulibacter americanus]
MNPFKSLSTKLSALTVVCAIVLGVALSVLAVRALDHATDDSRDRQATAATTAARTLGNAAMLQGDRLRARLEAAAAGAPTAQAAAQGTGRVPGSEAVAAVDAQGRTASGARLAVASQLDAAKSSTGVAEVIAADLQALGLADRAKIAVVESPMGRKIPETEITNALAVVSSVPTRDGGRLIGVRLVTRDAALVDQNSRLMGDSGLNTIFLGDVRVITTARNAKGARSIGTTMSPAVHDVVYGQNKAFTGEAMVVDKPYISHYEPIRDSGGKVIGAWYSGYPKGTLEAKAADARRNMLLAAIVLLAIVGAVAVLVTRRMLAPLTDLTHRLDAIAEGTIPEGAPVVRSDDELGRMAAAYEHMVAYVREMAEVARRIAAGDLRDDVQPRSEKDLLGTAFQTMTERLRHLLGRVSSSASTLSAATQEMATTSDEAGRAVSEIAEAVSDVAQGAERQVRSVEAARMASAEVSEATRSSAQSAQETATAATEARRIAGEGESAVSDATAAMREVRTSSDEVRGAMQQLAEKNDQIGGIVEAITGIAGQTNLLALNAAIEAARAGEQGRGFAVVAEEVRKLAVESQDAAKSIAQLVQEIHGETTRAVAVVEESAARSEGGAATVDRARDAFARIGASVDDMGERVDAIAVVVDQIAASSQRVEADMTEVAAVAEQSSASSEELSASTQQTSASAQEIAANAQRLAGTAAELEQLVNEFTLTR